MQHQPNLEKILKSTLLIALFVISMFASLQTALADQSQSACDQLARPNIDCGCVANKFQVYFKNANSTEVRQLLTQRYAYGLGLDNTLEDATRNLMTDPMEMVMAQQSFDNLGGMPENIEDFERGCVVPTTSLIEFAELKPNSAAAIYAESVIKDVGQKYRRNVICQYSRMSDYMTQDEIQAHHLSFSYYEGDHLNDDTASRAKKMGISKAEYQRIEKAGRAKYDNNRQSDENYCSAITYAEHFSDERIESDKLKEAALFEAFNAKAGSTAKETNKYGKSDLDQTSSAEYLMQQACQRQGKSEDVCQCVMNDFDKRVVQQSSRPNVALAWVLMSSSAGIDGAELLQFTQQLNPEDHQEAGQLFISTLDVGEQCKDASATKINLNGEPRARMMKICLADMEDETICKCAVDKMQSQFDEDDFELVVDLKDAEFQGAEDALAKVASDRGLTVEQMNQVLSTDKSLISAMMGMNVLSCVGNLPDMGQFNELLSQ